MFGLWGVWPFHNTGLKKSRAHGQGRFVLTLAVGFVQHERK